jgi:hypothetical protein
MAAVEKAYDLDEVWQFKRWNDGNEQVSTLEGRASSMFIERVDQPKSRRKWWRVVDRRGAGEELYPPALSAPFKNLEAAKAAYLVIVAART